MNLEVGDDHTGKSHQGANREINMASDDDENHARRHNSDHTGLYGEVIEISRREKDAVGKNIENDPDKDQCTDHCQHTGINLELCAQPIK